MKIIYIANARIPTEKAHGKQIMKTCEALAKLSNLELWLPNRRQSNLAGVDPFSYYGIKKNFTIKKFANLDLLQIAAKFPKPVQIFCFWLQQITFATSILLQNFDGEVIYTRSQLLAVLLSLNHHQVYYEAHNVSKFRFLLNKVAGIVVISQGLMKEFNHPNLLLAPDGFDSKEFEGLTKLDSKEKIVTYVGSRQKGKGVETLLEAEKYFRKSIKLQILTNVPPTKVPQYLKSSDLLILPNSAKDLYSRKYTSPMKLFEYLGSGVPIIATATEANLEILNPKNAVLIPPDDPKALVYAVNSNQNLKHLARQALLDSRNYTWAKRAQKIYEYINR